MDKKILLLLIATMGVFFNSQFAFATNWYNQQWTYRRLITVDHAKVSNSDQTDFPILVSITNADFKSVANSGKVAQDDGGDILFTDNSGTKLSHEFESYDPAAGTLAVWVRVPLLSSSIDTPIYIYYGNAACPDQWADDKSTWNDNFVLVNHMKDSGATTTIDSTQYSNIGAKTGVDEPIEIDGKIGKAENFDGTNDYISLNSVNGISSADSWTISAWLNPTLGQQRYLFESESHVQSMRFETTGAISIFSNSSVLGLISIPEISATSTAMASGNWGNIALSYDKTPAYGGTFSYYENGDLKTSYSIKDIKFTQSSTVTCCSGESFPYHLQGVTTDGSYYYWSFTNKLVKTDLAGNEIVRTDVPVHIGDPAYSDGKLYLPWADGFDPGANSIIYIYDATDLSLIEQHDISSQVYYGAGAIAVYNGHYYVAESTNITVDDSKIYEFDESWDFIQGYTINASTYLGLQSIARVNNNWWIGTYDSVNPSIRLDDSFNILETYGGGFSFGIDQGPDSKMILGSSYGDNQGKLILYTMQYGGADLLAPNTFKIGSDRNQSRVFKGIIDEFRFSDAARGAGWIKTEYNNQNDPASFYSLSSEEVVDNTPPVITVIGDNPVTVAQGSAYTDSGATATDNIDSSVTVVTSGTVDTATLGDYTITYNATDVAGNAATSATRLVHVTDQAIPTISAVNAGANQTAATITWTTNEAASSKVEYGITGSYGNSTNEANTTTRVTSHSVALSGLTACKTYHYRVKSKDAADNEGISNDSTFVTTGCSSGSAGGGANPIKYTPITPALTTPTATTTAAITAEVQKRIDLLKRLIALLQQQLQNQAGIQQNIIQEAAQTATAFSCAEITRTLFYGMNGAEVKCLQEVLKSQGRTIYPYEATGYYLNGTKLAVKKFQEKYTDEILKPFNLRYGNGVVGINTRKIINQLLAGQAMPAN